MSYAPDALSSGKGADLASAATITPTNVMHNVTGSAAISTITAPSGILSGQLLILVPKGLFTIGTGGTVIIAVSAVVNRVLILFWDATLTKWIPSYLS